MKHASSRDPYALSLFGSPTMRSVVARVHAEAAINRANLSNVMLQRPDGLSHLQPERGSRQMRRALARDLHADLSDDVS